MVQHDLKELMGKSSTFSARSSKRCSHTFAGEHISRGGLVKVIGASTTGPLPQEVPQQSEDYDQDTSDPTNHTTDYRSDRSRLCGNDLETGWHRGRRGRAGRGLNFGMVPTGARGDEEVVENKLISLVGYSHYNIDLVEAACESWCLEVDGHSCGGVNYWLLGSGCNAELIKRLTRWSLSGDSPEMPSTTYFAAG